MRHRKFGRTLGRRTNHRKAMFRNMAVALFTHGQITTTVPKAKALRPFVERLITAARKANATDDKATAIAYRRRVIAQLGGDKWMITDQEADNVERNRYGEIKNAPRITKYLFDEIAPKYADRDGGYTRIIRLGQNRLGDGTDLCVIQLVGEEDTDAPQTAGDRSRRAKSNKRMEYAAKLAKGAAKQESATAVAEPEEEVTEEAPAEEVAETETAEQTPEAEEEKKDDA